MLQLLLQIVSPLGMNKVYTYLYIDIPIHLKTCKDPDVKMSADLYISISVTEVQHEK